MTATNRYGLWVLIAGPLMLLCGLSAVAVVFVAMPVAFFEVRR